jgi:hypothetical protein
MTTTTPTTFTNNLNIREELEGIHKTTMKKDFAKYHSFILHNFLFLFYLPPSSIFMFIFSFIFLLNKLHFHNHQFEFEKEKIKKKEMKHAYVLWIVLNVQLFILPQNIKIHNGTKILHLPRSLKIMLFTQMKVLHC